MNEYDRLKEHLKKNQNTWLITGVAGFIGSNLLEKLLILNQKVIGLDNFDTGYKRNIEQAIQDANKEIAIETTRRQKELGIRLSSELKSAEDRIAGAKAKAVDGLHETASEVTMAALKLLLDKTPSEKSVRQAIISALDETNKEMNK